MRSIMNQNFICQYVIPPGWGYADMKEVIFIRTSLSRIKNKCSCLACPAGSKWIEKV